MKELNGTTPTGAASESAELPDLEMSDAVECPSVVTKSVASA